MNRFVALIAVALLAIACGEDDENNIFFPNANNGDAGNNATSANANTGTDGGMTSTDAGDVTGNCVVTRNLGVLGDMLSQDSEFTETGNFGATSCSGDNPDGESDGAAILQFSLDTPRRINVTVDGVPLFNNDVPVIPPDPSWEIRSAPCDTGDVAVCSATRNQEVDLPAGDYFLVINGRLDSGGYRLEITGEELVCMTGEPTCSNDQIERCVMGTALETYPCFDGCSSDAACTGDSCGDIVNVTVDASGQPYTISGHRRAHTNTWSAVDVAGCELFPGDPSPDTTGVELFVRVDGLTAGQTLIVDAEESDGNYAFFLLQDCAATTCLHAGDFDAEGSNKTEWRVNADGSVVLVVEALGTTEREIVVNLSIGQ